jgi:hypothetical protein
MAQGEYRISSSHTRLNLVNEAEHSRNRTLHAATEMNFGLHSASGRRLTRQGG